MNVLIHYGCYLMSCIKWHPTAIRLDSELQGRVPRTISWTFI